MKASEFERFVLNIVEIEHDGWMSASTGFSLNAYIPCYGISDALTYNKGYLKDLYPFILKNQTLSDEFTAEFFQDQEYPLSNRTLLTLKDRCHNPPNDVEAVFINFYESLLEKQKADKLGRANELKVKVDSLLDDTLTSISEAKRMLSAKIESLDAEIEHLTRKSGLNNETLTFFAPENIRSKKEKQNTIRAIVDCLVTVENDSRNIQNEVRQFSASEYPSINTLRLAFSKTYMSYKQDTNNIIKNNDSIAKHLGIGKITNYAIQFLTGFMRGYYTDTQRVIESSLTLVDNHIIRNGIC